MSKKVHLSVVIPMYNEVKNLERGVLDEVYSYLKKQKFTWEVVVSDDGSTDASKDFVTKSIKSKKNFRLIKNTHGGKPSALWYGIQKARGKYILFTDMDQSTPIIELGKLLPFFDSYNVIIGSRGHGRENFPIYRRLGSVVFMSFRKIFLLREINDTQCGFKVFKRDIVYEAFPKLEFFRKNQRSSGWKVTSYDVELLHITKKMGHPIKEVVVDWFQKDVSDSKGGGIQRYFRESIEMLGQILRVKYNEFRGYYNAK